MEKIKIPKIEILKEAARRRLMHFTRHCWSWPSPFVKGIHTAAICGRLDAAVAAFREGKSSRLIVTVPYRHGKSELVSRNFPPYFFGRFPDSEILLATHTADLSEKMSADAMRIIRDPRYAELFPDVRLSPKAQAVGYWEIEGRRGKLSAVGIGGSITGKGAELLIIDDYLKSREEAESLTIREKQWASFTNDLMTRLAPVHIVVILATRWHTDDIIGRILGRMASEPAYPRFELLKFPAKSEEYPGGYLFPERYGEDWYSAQFASLGAYAASALLQCEPVPRGGNLLKTDKVSVEDSFPDGLRYFRFWDLASTVKERVKDEPDWTVGTKLAVRREGNAEHIYVADVRRTREEAPSRNALIEQTAQLDGQGVTIGIESVAGYKDTFTLMKDLLGGRSRVVECRVSKDKIVRASPLEPVFEAGNVHVLRGEWNRPWLDELAVFPSGRHDDQVDSLSGGYELARQPCEFRIETAAMFDASRYY